MTHELDGQSPGSGIPRSQLAAQLGYALVAPLHIRNTILLLSTVRSILCLMGVAYVLKTIV
jgi:hypothetical protein